MARPPLSVGTYGKIGFTKIKSTGQVRARAFVRDYDGERRPITRFGPSKAAAERALKETLRDRIAPIAGDGMTPETKVRAVTAQWLDNVWSDEELSPNTKELYARTIGSVNAGLGSLRLREISVPAIDRFLSTVSATHGPGSAKTCRTVLSGVLGLAVRHGALTTNPVRDAGRIKRGRRKEAPRALTTEEQADLLAKVHKDQRAIDLDLPDLIDVLAGTGVRIGEALAIREKNVTDGAVEIAGTVVRIKGEGIVIQDRTKSDAGWRVIALPRQVVDILERRRPNADSVLLTTIVGNTRDPRNTARDLRGAFDRAGYPWVHAHTFRKTVATRLDEAGYSARQIADHLGHAHPSMTQDTYMGRKVTLAGAAETLDLSG